MLLDNVIKRDPDVVFLQETWLRAFNVVKLTKHFPGYKWFIKTLDASLHPEEQINRKNMSQHGTALGVKIEISDSAMEIQNTDPDIISVTLEVEGTEILLLSIYLPTRGKDEDFTESVGTLAEVMARVGRENVIGMGDLNVSTTHSKKRKSCWRAFLNEAGLIDNVRGHVTHRHKMTGKEDELDRLLTKNVEVGSVEVVKDVTNRSDHYPVLARVKVKTVHRAGPISEEEEQMMAQTKINLSKLDSEEFKLRTDELADQLRLQFEEGDYSKDDQNMIISAMIWKTAISITGQKPNQTQGKKRRRPMKIRPDIYNEARRRHKEYVRGGRIKNSQEHELYKAARRRLVKCVQMRTRKEEEATQLEIIKTQKTRRHKIFSVLKKVKQGMEAPETMPSKLSGYGRTYLEPNIMKGFKELYEIQGLRDT